MKKYIVTLIVMIAAVIMVSIVVNVVSNPSTAKETSVNSTEESNKFETYEVSDESPKYKVPETKVTGTLETEHTETELTYTDVEICSVFDDSIRAMCIEVFGEYLAVLQQAYVLVEKAGYEYNVPFTTDEENSILRNESYLEFTLYLPGARARVSISKDGNTYSTTLRMLEDGEMETTPILEEGDV